jgi:glycosyltransferase involved in cell wall biosynthesis
MSRLSHVAEVFFLAERMRRAGARHVHAQHADYLADAALAAAACLGIPFSFTGHANDLYVKPGNLERKIEAASFVSTCTAHNERHLQTLVAASKSGSGGRSRIVRVYHGADLERFTPPPRPGPPRQLVTVTRLKEKKGLPDLLDALALLREKGSDLALDIYGDGDQRDLLRARIEQLGLSGRVALRGAIEHERIPSILHGAGLFVLPCVVLPNLDRDGIPNTIIEALACGVPVVATAISGIPEVVRDGETGLLVPERDPEALARAIERMVNDAELRARCAREGPRIAAAQFSIEATGRALGDLFRRSVAEHEAGRRTAPAVPPGAERG